ncbi:MAG: VWA domain-containing protein [Chloracidobacterium sp.]|nr:VWA domain-containing protein [Chloracidobacterium sp.]MCO5334599.1 VWA domain-containing protein [Pyrinomonadaceae bacterium]
MCILFGCGFIKVNVMKYGGALAFALVFFAAAIAVDAQSGRVQPTPTPTPEPDERIETEEIKLNVLAFDENGNFFPGVTTNDLVITENDILHQPASVRRLPANVLLVLDTGGEMRSAKSLDRTRNAAAAVVRALQPDDRVAVVQYSDKVQIVDEWTTDRSRTLKAIMERTNFGRRSVFINALDTAADMLTRTPQDNRHLVLITDGTDSGGQLPERFDAYRRLTSTDISVHVLSYTAMETADLDVRKKQASRSQPPKAMPDSVAAQLPNGARDAATAPKARSISLDRKLADTIKSRRVALDTAQDELGKLAAGTNGEFILPLSPDEMTDKAALVAGMIDSYYVVTYVPKVPVVATRGIAERNIMVTSKRPGLIVEARRNVLIATGK